MIGEGNTWEGVVNSNISLRVTILSIRKRPGTKPVWFVAMSYGTNLDKSL